ncbi:MAG: nucleoside hydrolase-like domain-containing protein, partial [Acetobacterales bacterium]
MAKPRVIISTDIGGADPDDMESMAHALLVADQWDIKGLVSTPTKHGGRASDIHKAIDAYTKDYGNLKTWSSDYPTPDYLKGIVTQGNVNVAPSAGYSYSTAGSKAIVKAAHEAKSAGEPLWVLTWGALTDVAQALHDDPSIRPTLRVLYSDAWNGEQDPNANKYVLENHVPKGLWIIDNNSTFRGIYINSEGKEGNPFQMSQVKGHGELGDYFYESRPWGVKMGDSWTIAYLTDKANDHNPGADSWGGTYVKTGKGPNYWTDDTSKGEKIAWYNGANHIRDHQEVIYKDMYRLFDRAKSPNPNADKDASADSGGGTTSPPPAPAPDTSSGTGNAVYAVD